MEHFFALKYYLTHIDFLTLDFDTHLINKNVMAKHMSFPLLDIVYNK